MSTGLVICLICHKEVHQDGPQHTWRHCCRFHGWSPICDEATRIYPQTKVDIIGMYCQADGLALEE